MKLKDLLKIVGPTSIVIRTEEGKEIATNQEYYKICDFLECDVLDSKNEVGERLVIETRYAIVIDVPKLENKR